MLSQHLIETYTMTRIAVSNYAHFVDVTLIDRYKQNREELIKLYAARTIEA